LLDVVSIESMTDLLMVHHYLISVQCVNIYCNHYAVDRLSNSRSATDAGIPHSVLSWLRRSVVM